MSHLRIAIVGAGPSGLTLACLLQANNIPCKVFELDETLESRDQGGTIDLHGQGGQLALLEAGLMDEFRKRSRPEGEAVKAIMWDGTVLLEQKDGSNRPEEVANRPEIDRRSLRKMLFESVDPETAIWNKKLLSVKSSAQEEFKYDLEFADGLAENYDLVVGAEGAWSRVRKLLTDVEPFYAGATMIECWAHNVEEKKPWLSDFVGQGTLFMFDEGRLITAQRSERDIRTYVGVKQSNKDWLDECGIDWSQAEQAKKTIVEKYFNDCHEDLKRVIMECDDRLVPRKMWHLPVGLKWTSRPGITLTGDAAHLMTPASGIGVNLAMLDALDLAKAIINTRGDKTKLPDAIKEYEAEMYARSEMWGKKTLQGWEDHFSATGLQERVVLMQRKLAVEKAYQG